MGFWGAIIVLNLPGPQVSSQQECVFDQEMELPVRTSSPGDAELLEWPSDSNWQADAPTLTASGRTDTRKGVSGTELGGDRVLGSRSAEWLLLVGRQGPRGQQRPPRPTCSGCTGLLPPTASAAPVGRPKGKAEKTLLTTILDKIRFVLPWGHSLIHSSTTWLSWLLFRGTLAEAVTRV